jgi:hypothetical protein
MAELPGSEPAYKKAKIQGIKSAEEIATTIAGDVEPPFEREVDKEDDGEPEEQGSESLQTVQPAESSTASSTKKMQISVKTSEGNTVALDVEDTDLVERIKSLIQDKLDIPVEKIDLMIEDFGQTCYQMDDYRSLRFYDVIDGSVLHLAERVQVNVRTVSGALVASLQVSPFDSACRVHHDALVAWGKPEYMSNTRLLMGDHMPFMNESMSHYNVQNGSELTLVVYDLDSGRSKD